MKINLNALFIILITCISFNAQAQKKSFSNSWKNIKLQNPGNTGWSVEMDINVSVSFQDAANNRVEYCRSIMVVPIRVFDPEGNSYTRQDVDASAFDKIKVEFNAINANLKSNGVLLTPFNVSYASVSENSPSQECFLKDKALWYESSTPNGKSLGGEEAAYAAFDKGFILEFTGIDAVVSNIPIREIGVIASHSKNDNNVNTKTVNAKPSQRELDYGNAYSHEQQIVSKRKAMNQLAKTTTYIANEIITNIRDTRDNNIRNYHSWVFSGTKEMIPLQVEADRLFERGDYDEFLKKDKEILIKENGILQKIESLVKWKQPLENYTGILNHVLNNRKIRLRKVFDIHTKELLNSREKENLENIEFLVKYRKLLRSEEIQYLHHRNTKKYPDLCWNDVECIITNEMRRFIQQAIEVREEKVLRLNEKEEFLNTFHVQCFYFYATWQDPILDKKFKSLFYAEEENLAKAYVLLWFTDRARVNLDLLPGYVQLKEMDKDYKSAFASTSCPTCQYIRHDDRKLQMLLEGREREQTDIYYLEAWMDEINWRTPLYEFFWVSEKKGWRGIDPANTKSDRIIQKWLEQDESSYGMNRKKIYKKYFEMDKQSR